MENTHGTDLYVVIERYTPAPGKLDEVLSMTNDIGKTLHGFEGLLMLQVLKPSGSKGDVVSTATWESEAAFKGFMQSDAVKDLMKSDAFSKMQELTTSSSFDGFSLVSGWHAAH
ncbi:MAG: antibiotic biosynthesis monooxygenase family protein [SAR324 cluster bacterium]|nr:antibiotic biosynthesis monooxygenase family protein [SAR324 cluster bacterium]